MRKRLYFDAKLGVKLIQTDKDRFTVRYFEYARRGLTYRQAASELGACIMHALSRAQSLDAREKAEAEWLDRVAGDPTCL